MNDGWVDDRSRSEVSVGFVFSCVFVQYSIKVRIQAVSADIVLTTLPVRYTCEIDRTSHRSSVETYSLNGCSRNIVPHLAQVMPANKSGRESKDYMRVSSYN